MLKAAKLNKFSDAGRFEVWDVEAEISLVFEVERVYMQGKGSKSGMQMRCFLFLCVFMASLYSEINEIVLQLEGLACPFCNTHLVRKLEQVKGVGNFRCDLKSNIARFKWVNEKPFSPMVFYNIVYEAGYDLKSIGISAVGRIYFQDGSPFFESSGDHSAFLLTSYRGGEESSVVLNGTIEAPYDLVLHVQMVRNRP